MKKFGKISAILLALTLLLALVSCKAGNDYASSYPGYAEDYYDKNESIGGDGSTIISGTTEVVDYTKIIKTVSASGETKEYDKCISELSALVAKHKGYIETSEVSGNSYSSSHKTRSAYYVFRIPAENLEAFKSDIAALINITRLSENIQNVSQQYYDLEAMIETLESERKGLLQILESINTSTQYDYWLTVTERLADIEQDIAIYKSQFNQLGNRIAYSTYSLNLNETAEYTEPTPDSFGDRIGSAIKNSWSDFADGAQDFAVWFVAAFPTLLVLGAIGVAVFFIVTSVIKKNKKNNSPTDNSENK